MPDWYPPADVISEPPEALELPPEREMDFAWSRAAFADAIWMAPAAMAAVAAVAPNAGTNGLTSDNVYTHSWRRRQWMK